MAKKTIRVSDISGVEIPDGHGAVVRITRAAYASGPSPRCPSGESASIALRLSH
jgi:hypothetical protein